jgi:hypothetical protein
MSKPEIPGELIPLLPPDQQIKIFLDLYRDQVNPASLARLHARVRELGLAFPADELLIIAALDTPKRVQEFLNTQVYYNNDHLSVEQDETALPPRRVLQTARAHCFEGAMFAYVVNFLHGHNPRWALLEASQDSEHNLVICQDPATGLYGSNAHSRVLNLDGRVMVFQTLRGLAESYYMWYYSDRTNNFDDLTLVGYSDSFDLVAEYGHAWMDTEEHLWQIYYTYIDDTRVFRFIYDVSCKTHLYAVIAALKHKWIRLDTQGKPYVSVSDLPPRAQELWRAFWRVNGDNTIYRRPRGEARQIEQEFLRMTDTTPIDLDDNAFDFQFYLASGHRIEDLTNKSVNVR